MSETWTWRTSTRSAGNGACVEIGTHRDTPMIGVRDSKLSDDSPILIITPDRFAALTKDMKAGRFTVLD
ncbi:DUF397 domain-containing protein [Actinokineospora terrae]|uniref:DUF397 domain-containing protein n=1 Tax=Actinokineospora terrae TaxID=155974 RepID=A0A1H9M9U2_9PSEU|nr:DUF397 domain-containing protein [Actinokineospora terrae]SER20225.1 protein of unknown function [Actinokineospora terrae]